MAARIGVPDEVIRKARARISEDDAEAREPAEAGGSRYAAGLRSERAALEQELAAAQAARGARPKQRSGQREDEARSIKAKRRLEAREVVAALRQKLRELSRAAGTGAGRASGSSRGDRIASAGNSNRDTTGTGAPSGRFPISIPATGCGSRGGTGRPRCLLRAAGPARARRGRQEAQAASSQEVVPIEPLRGQQSAYTAPGWGADLS